MKPKSLSSINPYLRGPDALYLHARNVATSTAVETGKPAEAYIERCLMRHGDGGPDPVPERRETAGESGANSRGHTKKC